jgi:hypothetical protein
LTPYIAKQLPCQNAPDTKRRNPFVFSKEDGVCSPKIAENIEAGGRTKPTWWFSANSSERAAGGRAGKRGTGGYKSGAPKNTKAPIVNRGQDEHFTGRGLPNISTIALMLALSRIFYVIE